jgi:hypothetical protein
MKNKRTRKNKRKQTRKNKRRRTKKGGMLNSVAARSIGSRLSTLPTNAAKWVVPSLASIMDLNTGQEVSKEQKLPAYFRQEPPPPPPTFNTQRSDWFGKQSPKSPLANAVEKAANSGFAPAQGVVNFKHHLAATSETVDLARIILTDLGFLKNTIPLIISMNVNTDWTDPENINTYYKQLFGLLDPVIHAAVSKQDLNTRTLAPKLIEQMVGKESLAEKMLVKIFQENTTFQIALDEAADLFDELIPEIWNHLKVKGVNCNLTTSPLYSQEEQVTDLKRKIKICIGPEAYNIGRAYEQKIRTFFINETGGFLYEIFAGIQTNLLQLYDYEVDMEIELDKFKIKTSIAEKLDTELTDIMLSAFIVDVEKIKENPSEPVIQQIKTDVEKEFQNQKVTVDQFIKFDGTVLQQLISNIYERTLDKKKKGLPYTVTDCILESIDLSLSNLLHIQPEFKKIYNQPTVDMCIEELKEYLGNYTDMQKQMLVSCITSRANELFK